MSSLITFFAQRFVAGDRLDQALKVVERLNKSGFHTTLDHLGEEVKNREEAIDATNDYIEIISALEKHGLERNVSIKLSQIGMAIDSNLCETNLRKIIDAARAHGCFVRVDIEGSAYTQTTYDIVKKVKNDDDPIGAAVQAMLIRSRDDVTELLRNRITVRLCKGAYKEPASIAYQTRKDIRHQYHALMEKLVASGLYHGIATHDDELIEATKAFIDSNHIERSAFEFQMLMGIRPGLQKRLLKEGWNVRVYVPFGSHWLPYMLRRLREKKENVWFVLSSFFKK